MTELPILPCAPDGFEREATFGIGFLFEHGEHLQEAGVRAQPGETREDVEHVDEVLKVALLPSQAASADQEVKPTADGVMGMGPMSPLSISQVPLNIQNRSRSSEN